MELFPGIVIQYRHRLLMAVSLAALASPTFAQTAHLEDAQAAVAEVPQRGGGGGLEEIVVTARKRSENLQDTPLSVAAFSANALQARQVTNVADVGKFTPNVSFEQGAASSGASFVLTTFIRGVGQSDFNLTIDPGVGLYVDGVYVSRSVGALLDTADAENVQVLRGPQGTLFGKNTIGGAIVITSKRPSADFEAEVEATTGRYNRADIRGMVNIPVSDMVKLRSSLSYQSRDGYVRRLIDGGKMGNRNSLSGRVQLLAEPSDDLSILLSGDYTRKREQSLPVILLGVNESADPSLNLFSQFYNWVLAPTQAGLPPFSICGAPGTPAPASDPRCFTSRWITGSKNQTYATGANRSDLDLWGASAVIDWDIGAAKLKSITAFRKLTSHFEHDEDVSPVGILEPGNDYYQRQFSQEFQLTGKALDDRLNWLAGLFYMKEKGTDHNRVAIALADVLSGAKVDNDSLAGFSQISFKVTPRLGITVGARYTYEKKRFLPDQRIINDKTGGSLLALSRLLIPDPLLNPNGDLLLPPIEGTTTAKEFTPSFTVDYKVTPDAMAYASYSKGFKSGGFTQRVFPPLATVPSFEPEYVTSYEAGVKTELFDRRLRLNAAAFLANYNGLQITVSAGATPTTRNAGKARIKGFELESEAQLSSWMRLNGGLGYTDAYYLSVSPLATEVTINNKLPYVPKWTATGGVTLGTFDVGPGNLSFRGDMAYKGAQFLKANNTPFLYQKGVTLLNVSGTIEDPDGHWLLSAGVTNLTNRKYLMAGFEAFDAPNSAGFASGTFSRGAEWFLRLRYRI